MEQENKTVQLFENGDWKIRTVEINGDPWFVGKDVAESLGYSNPLKAVRDHVDDEDKGMNKTFTPGGIQDVMVINESGVYALVFSSKLPTAKEFKHWVTSEVLPSIRKHGAYATPQTIDNILQDPDFGIRLLQELKKEREEKIEAQKALAIAEPKAEVYDVLASVNKTLTLSDTAKEIKCGMGSHTFVKKLLEDGYLFRTGNGRYKGDLRPMQKWLDKGLFILREGYDSKTLHPFVQPRVTFAGREYFAKKYGKAEWYEKDGFANN